MAQCGTISSKYSIFRMKAESTMKNHIAWRPTSLEYLICFYYSKYDDF